MFETQPPAGHQVTWCCGNDVPQGVHAVSASAERKAGFMTDIRKPEMRIVLAHIRRIADDEIEFSGERSEPVARDEADLM